MILIKFWIYIFTNFWPSSILGCLLIAITSDSVEVKALFFSFMGIWILIGLACYMLNGIDNFKETLINNLIGWLSLAIIIALISFPLYTLALIILYYFIHRRVKKTSWIDKEIKDGRIAEFSNDKDSFVDVEKMMLKDNLFDKIREELYQRNIKNESNNTLSNIERLKSHIISSTLHKFKLSKAGKILIRQEERCEAILYFYLYWIALSDTEPPSLDDMIANNVKQWISNCENYGNGEIKFILIDMKEFMKCKTKLFSLKSPRHDIKNIINQASFIEEDQRVHFVSFAKDIIGHNDDVWEEQGDDEAWKLLEEAYIDLAKDSIQKISLIIDVKTIN